MTHREFIQKQIQPFLPKKIKQLSPDYIQYDDDQTVFIEDVISHYIRGWMLLCDEWDAADLLDVEFAHIYL